MAAVSHPHSKIVNTKFIIKVYDLIQKGMEIASAIKKGITICSIIIDGGITQFVDFIIGKVIAWLSSLFDLQQIVAEYLLAAIIAVEYFIRTGNSSRAANLKNKCSICHCKGHNSQNCSKNKDWIAFSKKLSSDVAGKAVNGVNDHLSVAIEHAFGF